MLIEGKHLLCKENRPLSVKINVYSIFSRYNAEIKEPKTCCINKASCGLPENTAFYVLPPYSEALRCYSCLCHLNVTGKKKWTDRLNLVISVSAHRIPCLPLQKFIINCISKSGSEPLLSAIIFKVTEGNCT